MSQTTRPVIQHPMHFATLCREHQKCDIQTTKVLKKSQRKEHGKKAQGEEYTLTFWRRNYFLNFSTLCI